MAVVQIVPFKKYDTGHPRRHIVMQPEQFEWMGRFLSDSPALSFDFETSGTQWFKHSRPCGVSFSGWTDLEGQHSFYVPYRHRTAEPQWELDRVHKCIDTLLRDDRQVKIAHNLKFDNHMARVDGWRVSTNRFDTLVGAWMHDETRPLSLKDRAVSDLGRVELADWDAPIDRELVRLAAINGLKLKAYKENFGYCQVDIGILGGYACIDAETTLQLYWYYVRQGIPTKYARVWNTEMELTEVLTEMEIVGMPLDLEYIHGLRERLLPKRQEVAYQIDQVLGYHLDVASDDCVFDAIRRVGLPAPTRKNKKSVGKEALDPLVEKHPLIPLILQWREFDKILTTYTTSLLTRTDKNGVLHPDYRSAGTGTGRLSCKNPNFQNQPSDSDDRAVEFSGKSLEQGGVDPYSVRRAYPVRKPGWVRLFWDFSQIELRVAAWYTQDPVMVAAYLNGEDIHNRTSLECFGSTEKKFRRVSKVINFGVSYGLSTAGLIRQTGMAPDEAEAFMQTFKQRFSGIGKFQQKFWAWARSNGGYFQNSFGRPRRVPDLLSPDGYTRGGGERRSFGSLIQGTAAELTKESLCRLHRRFAEERLEALICATVHDEIQVDCPEDLAPVVGKIMTTEMERFPEFDPIPIVVDGEITRTNWADKEGVEF